jgi:hypothetical protein
MEIPKHKVFISYYHKDDQQYKDYLIEMAKKYDVFVDWSVAQDEVDDTNKTSERVREIIRDEYIKDATVMIVLCGKNTKYRKHVDWEIHADMFDSPKNPQMGILVVNLPTIAGMSQVRAGGGDYEEKQIISPNSTWVSYSTRKEYEEDHPCLPIRLIDNFTAAITDRTIVPITVVNWDTIVSSPLGLKKLLDNAFNRGKNKNLHYDHSRKLKGRNS